MKIEYTYKTMTWDEAVDFAIHEGMYLPNKRQCEELKLFGCWTSTTNEKNYHEALVGCLHTLSKQKRMPVIMYINSSISVFSKSITSCLLVS